VVDKSLSVYEQLFLEAVVFEDILQVVDVLCSQPLSLHFFKKGLFAG
jgi:hypothetical protein